MEIINISSTTPGDNARMCTSDALLEPHIEGGSGQGFGTMPPVIPYPCYWNIDD